MCLNVAQVCKSTLYIHGHFLCISCFLVHYDYSYNCNDTQATKGPMLTNIHRIIEQPVSADCCPHQSLEIIGKLGQGGHFFVFL